MEIFEVDSKKIQEWDRILATSETTPLFSGNESAPALEANEAGQRVKFVGDFNDASYFDDPIGKASVVRKALKISEGEYFSCTTWPPHLAGRVFLTGEKREVPSFKISKSDHP